MRSGSPRRRRWLRGSRGGRVLVGATRPGQGRRLVFRLATRRTANDTNTGAVGRACASTRAMRDCVAASLTLPEVGNRSPVPKCTIRSPLTSTRGAARQAGGGRRPPCPHGGAVRVEHERGVIVCGQQRGDELHGVEGGVFAGQGEGERAVVAPVMRRVGGFPTTVGGLMMPGRHRRSSASSAETHPVGAAEGETTPRRTTSHAVPSACSWRSYSVCAGGIATSDRRRCGALVAIHQAGALPMNILVLALGAGTEQVRHHPAGHRAPMAHRRAPCSRVADRGAEAAGVDGRAGGIEQAVSHPLHMASSCGSSCPPHAAAVVRPSGTETGLCDRDDRGDGRRPHGPHCAHAVAAAARGRPHEREHVLTCFGVPRPPSAPAIATERVHVAPAVDDETHPGRRRPASMCRHANDTAVTDDVGAVMPFPRLVATGEQGLAPLRQLHSRAAEAGLHIGRRRARTRRPAPPAPSPHPASRACRPPASRASTPRGCAWVTSAVGRAAVPSPRDRRPDSATIGERIAAPLPNEPCGWMARTAVRQSSPPRMRFNTLAVLGPYPRRHA